MRESGADPRLEQLCADATSWELPGSTISTSDATTGLHFEKLVLHGPGEATTVFMRAEERKLHVYAYVAIALASSFEGGRLRVFVRPEALEYDQAKAVEFGTSATTWLGTFSPHFPF